jgi:WD40 repeat protein
MQNANTVLWLLIRILLPCIIQHVLTWMLADLVTCVALDQCGSFLITGSRDTTCVVWDVSQLGTGSSSAIHMTPRPVQTLCGHDKAVTCVGIMTELDMAVSGSLVSWADSPCNIGLCLHYNEIAVWYCCIGWIFFWYQLKHIVTNVLLPYILKSNPHPNLICT